MARPRNSQNTGFTATGKIFKAPKDGGFVCKITINNVSGYFHYEELKEAIASRIVNIEDALGKRRSDGVEVELTLNEEPDTYNAGSGKTYLDVTSISITAFRLL